MKTSAAGARARDKRLCCRTKGTNTLNQPMNSLLKTDAELTCFARIDENLVVFHALRLSFAGSCDLDSARISHL